MLAREAQLLTQPIHALPEPSDEIHAVKKQREVFVGFLFMAKGDGCVLCRELAIELIGIEHSGHFERFQLAQFPTELFGEVHCLLTEINERQQLFHLREIALYFFDVFNQLRTLCPMHFFHLTNVLLSLFGLTFEGFNLLFQCLVLLLESLDFAAAKE